MAADTKKVCLPFFNSSTKEFARAAQRLIQQRTRQDGLLAQIGSHPVFEGRRTSIKQPDQSVRDTEFSQISAELTSKFSDLNNLNRAYVEETIAKLADQFRNQMTKSVIELMSKVTEETGNIFDAGGKPLTHELMMDLQRSMPAISYPNDLDSNYVMVVHPDMIPKLEALEVEFQNSPELQKQFREMKAQKNEEYRSDQLARKLVG